MQNLDGILSSQKESIENFVRFSINNGFQNEQSFELGKIKLMSEMAENLKQINFKQHVEPNRRNTLMNMMKAEGQQL